MKGNDSNQSSMYVFKPLKQLAVPSSESADSFQGNGAWSPAACLQTLHLHLQSRRHSFSLKEGGTVYHQAHLWLKCHDCFVNAETLWFRCSQTIYVDQLVLLLSEQEKTWQISRRFYLRVDLCLSIRSFASCNYRGGRGGIFLQWNLIWFALGRWWQHHRETVRLRWKGRFDGRDWSH